VDYALRQSLLAELDGRLAEGDLASVATRLLESPRDHRLKLFSTMMLLRYRREHREIFERGGYQPLAADGLRRDHLFAFARAHGDNRVLVAVPRLIATLLPDAGTPPIGERAWGDTVVRLPGSRPRQYRHVLTGQTIDAVASGDGTILLAAEMFADFPVAVLEAS
jgi:(1->4)-alpha-D-glucan 1-alpha-D-glucosylmutase